MKPRNKFEKAVLEQSKYLQSCRSRKHSKGNCSRSTILRHSPLAENTKCCGCSSSWLKWRKAARLDTMCLKSVSIGGTHKDERRLLPFREYWEDTLIHSPIVHLWQSATTTKPTDTQPIRRYIRSSRYQTHFAEMVSRMTFTIYPRQHSFQPCFLTAVPKH